MSHPNELQALKAESDRRRQERANRYARMLAAHAEGLSVAELAERFGLRAGQVRDFLLARKAKP